MQPLKAISVTQPWSTLIAIGGKNIETRSWRTDYHGWIAIHAAKSMHGADEMRCLREPFYSALRKAGLKIPCRLERGAHLTLTRGAIVAVANLHKVERIRIRAADGATIIPSWPIPKEEIPFGDYTPGRYAWVLTNSRPLKEPIPCRGALGLWDVPAEIAEQLERGGYLR